MDNPLEQMAKEIDDIVTHPENPSDDELQRISSLFYFVKCSDSNFRNNVRFDSVFKFCQKNIPNQQKRKISDARKIITSGKKIVLQNPNNVLTDCLNSYQEAIRKEFENKTAHIKTKSLKDGFVNRPIERYHNEIREKLKARRGLGNDESAHTFYLLQVVLGCVDFSPKNGFRFVN